MGLSGVMAKALSGMRVTQSGIDVVSQNISNADAVGYNRRRVNVIEQVTGETSGGARVGSIERILDKLVQRQLWSETSGGGYTSTRAEVLQGLTEAFGAPDSSSALGAVFGRFTQSLQQLKGDPASYTLRTAVLTNAQEMAARLQDLSANIQELRTQSEIAIGAGVTEVNNLLDQLETVNGKILDTDVNGSNAALRDERDRIVTSIARYIDIKTTEGPTGAMSVFTTSGVTLFNGSSATKLSFDGVSSVGADQLWNADDTLRGVGTIRALDNIGVGYDMIATNSLRSGELSAYVELRDRTLVQAQNQLDELAAAMAGALSDREVNGVAATAGAATGFDVDTTGLLSGNQITLDYTNSVTGMKGRFTFVRADSAAAVTAIAGSGMSSADNMVVGIDFSGGMASVVTQIQAAVGAGFTVSNAGATLRIVDDGAGNTRDVNALVSRPTVTNFSNAAPNGVPELPFFVDQGVTGGIYTGSWEGRPQIRGLSSRIAVNPALLADRSRLVQYQTLPTTPQGDTVRVNQLFDRLTSQTRVFSPQTGIGGTAASLRSTVAAFAARIVDNQGSVTENAKRLNEGQQVALKSVEARYSEKSGVSVDQEMANLVELQNAYAANARVISAVKEMMDLLLRI